MTERHRTLPGAWEDTDVACVVGTLHQVGPLGFRDLHHEPNLVDWSEQRLEHAVVSAWSRNLISIDSHDLFLAL